MQKTKKKTIKVRDLKPKKDAKGGGGMHHLGSSTKALLGSSTKANLGPSSH